MPAPLTESTPAAACGGDHEPADPHAAQTTQDKLLTLVLDATPALISYVGADGRYRRVNRSYERWFGLAPDAVQGRHVREVLGEAAWQAVRPFIERALSGETLNYEIQIPYRDGGLRWVAVTYTPDRNPAGGVDGFIAHVVDIDGRKRGEAEIRSLNAALQTSVALRTAQMQASNRDLEDFSYSVSHDLRAPLRAIDSFSKILLDEYRDRLDAEGQRLLGTVRRNVATMGRLIDDILAFSRAGRRALELTAVDVAALAREVFDTLRPLAGERGIELRVGALPPARADRAALRQVLVNLLSNAIKFTGPRSQALIEISGRVDGLNAEYAIRDNGVGFDADYGHKLFGIFQRLHTADAFPGTGIGLAIVKRLVDKHGGRIWAESQPGQSATFHFALPLAAAPPATEPP